MKLVYLYSNDSRFKEIKFSDGFNVILGKIEDEKNLNKDSHNLGKSSLIELIDFMLLKDLRKGNFLKGKHFENHIFFLQIKLNDGRYLTIKRAIKNNTKISFKFSKLAYDNYTYEPNWDYTNLPLNSEDKTMNPKYLLNKFLDYDVLKDYIYRSFTNYFLRHQKDYSDEFHLSKFSGGDSSWKPLLFEMLGFNSEFIKEKYILEKDFNDKKKVSRKVKK